MTHSFTKQYYTYLQFCYTNQLNLLLVSEYCLRQLIAVPVTEGITAQPRANYLLGVIHLRTLTAKS